MGLGALSEDDDGGLFRGTLRVTVTLWAPSPKGRTELFKSCMYSSKLNDDCRGSVEVAELPANTNASFSWASGGASRLIAANNSSAVGPPMNVSGSSPRARNASSNAGEPHVPGGG